MNEDIEAYRKGTKKISEEYIRKTEIEAYNVDAYKVVGYWYFDKRQGELKYRLLGICPVVPDVYEMDNPNPEMVELFWVYFPSTRDILHEATAFNNRNSAMPFSFDHILNARRFSGVIYLEENVYGDRKIADYMKENAQMQLLESDRVKEKIRDFEQDMWNY
jgi:gliding motility associated protien GldN